MAPVPSRCPHRIQDGPRDHAVPGQPDGGEDRLAAPCHVYPQDEDGVRGRSCRTRRQTLEDEAVSRKGECHRRLGTQARIDLDPFSGSWGVGGMRGQGGRSTGRASVLRVTVVAEYATPCTRQMAPRPGVTSVRLTGQFAGTENRSRFLSQLERRCRALAVRVLSASCSSWASTLAKNSRLRARARPVQRTASSCPSGVRRAGRTRSLVEGHGAGTLHRANRVHRRAHLPRRRRAHSVRPHHGAVPCAMADLAR